MGELTKVLGEEAPTELELADKLEARRNDERYGSEQLDRALSNLQQRVQLLHVRAEPYTRPPMRQPPRGTWRHLGVSMRPQQQPAPSFCLYRRCTYRSTITISNSGPSQSTLIVSSPR